MSPRPFTAIFAVAPDTGKIKWIYAPRPISKSQTQIPRQKPRPRLLGTPPIPVAGQACQKILYVGTVDSKLHAVDADTGKPVPGFGENGMLDINQWNTVNHIAASILPAAAVYKDTLMIGWAGEDWPSRNRPPARCSASMRGPAR